MSGRDAQTRARQCAVYAEACALFALHPMVQPYQECGNVQLGWVQVLGVCDNSGEDPRCHNSVCFLGLCTSISDHLQYLGAHMYNDQLAPC